MGRDVCAMFRISDFYKTRGKVESTLLREIQYSFGNGTTHARPGFLQLKNIVLPNKYLTAVENEALMKQDIEKASEERSAALKEADTKKLTGQKQAEVILLQAKKTAEGLV